MMCHVAMSRLVRWVFLLLSLPLLLAFPYVRALGNPNELVRVYTVIAIVENGTYHLDEQVELFGHTEDMAYVNDHYVMVKAPGNVHLGVPPYWLFSKVIAPVLGLHYPRAETPDAELLRLDWLRKSTWFLRMTTSQLPCLLFLWWLERYLRAFSSDAVLRCAAIAAVGLGSNVLAYAHMFASHTLYAIVAFVAFATVERELREPTSLPFRRALLVGFLTSACVTLEYQALFMTFALSAFALWVFRRASLGFVLGGVLNVPLVMWFQHCAYGNAFTPGHKLLENPQFVAEHSSGLWGISWPTAHAMGALATDPSFGFFALSPFMWLGLLSIPVFLYRGRPHLRVVTLAWAGCMAAVFFVNAGFVEWRAGWTVGARYLVVCAPFFAFGALLLLERFAEKSDARRALARGTAVGLAFAGVIAVGTVGMLVDTLPDGIGRPFAQFFVPMFRAGFVAHDLGESFGLGRLTWYVACAALLCAPLALLVLRAKGERRLLSSPHACAAFVLAAACGLAPAFTTPPDGTALFVLHPSTAWFAQRWEPPAQ